MTEPYETTLSVLARSKNRAAARILAAAMHSSHQGIKVCACKKAIHHWSSRKLLDVLRQFDTLSEASLAALQENPSKLILALRTGLLTPEPTLQRNCVQAAIQLRAVELIPSLLQAMLDSPAIDQVDVPIVELTYQLVLYFRNDLAQSQERLHGQKVLLKDIADVLLRSFSGPQRSNPQSVLKVLLYLYPQLLETAPILDDVFRNPNHQGYRPLLRVVSEGKDEAVIPFITDTLRLPGAPGMTIVAVARRADVAFLRAVLEQVSENPPEPIRANLSRVHRFEWLSHTRSILAQLDETFQTKLVWLVKYSSISPDDALKILDVVVQFGHSEARRTAMFVMMNLPGDRGDELVLSASQDADPEVQAAAVLHLRARKTPNTMARLIELAASPHAVVQEAVRNALPEFRIDRFLEMFDKMTPEQQQKSFRLVLTLDSRTCNYLKRELLYSPVDRKMRALRCILVGDIVPQMEEPLCALLSESPEVELRVAAADLLGRGQRELSRNTLLQSQHNDTSMEVRKMAKSSLDARR